ncbi:MAG TPA: hypothetical protein DD766_03120 [Desulfovibrio sp.]|jgi:signal transduction histidine kinase|nr:hypothetical protein [Desulfovibrio sp.]HBR06087.1 hypothetical protein [Desulfovibrio sp.]
MAADRDALLARLAELERENRTLSAKIRLLDEARAKQERIADTHRALLRCVNKDYEQSLAVIERQHADALRLTGELTRFQNQLQNLVAERTTALHQANERLRNLSVKVLAAQETERRWLSMELHDGVLQSLAAVHIFLQTELQGLARQLPGQPFDKLHLAVRTVGEVMRDMREVVASLRPPMLDDVGLEAALRALVKKCLLPCPAIRARISIELGEAGLHEEQKIICYRILQEALSNAARHSRARNLRVEVCQDHAGLAVSVQDDGVGFDPAAPRLEGVGIESMRERVRLIGGRFQLEAAPGRGVRLCAYLPGPLAPAAP